MSAEEAEAAYAKLEREGKLEEARRLILKHERREAERNRSERVHVPIITHHLHWAPILALLYIVVAAAANRLFPAKTLPTARGAKFAALAGFSAPEGRT